MKKKRTQSTRSKLTEEQIRSAVRETYGAAAERTVVESASQCCNSGDGKKTLSCCFGASLEETAEYAKQLGYTEKDTSIAAASCSNLGLGCGNPIALASLKKGEVVLDLGSGAGFDCFLAAKKVGLTGHVIGIDMTPAMLEKSRTNAIQHKLTNVEFRLGEIEHIPVADNSVDVVISNCVINLSPNKLQVFREALRVLKPGGRLAISDVIATQKIPNHIRKDLALYTGCMAGATSVKKLRETMHKCGFGKLHIEVKEDSRSYIRHWTPDSHAEDYVAAAAIFAYKPKLVA